MFKRPFSSNQILFFGSILLPYLLDLFPIHSAGTHDVSILLYDFVALLTLGVLALVLAVGTSELRSNGKGLIYLAIAPAAVALYFYSLDARIGMREQVEFFLNKSELEAHVAQLRRGEMPPDSLNHEYQSYVQLSSGIALCTTEGEASVYSGGYAYSPADKKPFDGEYYEWRKLYGHWYKWKRREG